MRPTTAQASQTRPGAIPSFEAAHLVNRIRPDIRHSQDTKRHSIDSLLVDAIAKTMVEQLRLHSVVSSHTSTSKSAQLSSDSRKDSSRTPSQRQALDRFVKELQRYADNVNAAGRFPIATPAPSKSPATLRTVSALLPYRPEFRSAGLAVTSHDQVQRNSHAATHLPDRHKYRRKIPPRPLHEINAMDGKQDTLSLPSTEVDFADPNTVNVWRRALIEHVPSRRHAYVLETDDSSAPGCLPCLSPKHVLRETEELIPNAETAGPNVSQPVPGAEGQPRTRRVTSQSKRTTGLRPKGFSVPRTVKLPSDECHHRNQTNPSCNLRPTRQLQLYPKVSIPTSPTPQRTRTGDQEPPLPLQRGLQNSTEPPRAGGIEMPVPLRLFPKIVPNTQRLAQKWHQARISPAPTESVRVATVQPMPQTDGRSKKRLGHKSFAPSGKTAMAKQEIAQHDHGPWPYPAHDPQPRPRGCGVALWPPRIPSRKSSKRQLRSTPNIVPDNASVFDGDVLRGLCIATTAACDKATAEFLHEKTGVHIRRFLAELIHYDHLTQGHPRDTVEERKRRRRSQIRMLKQQVRMSQELQKAKIFQAL